MKIIYVNIKAIFAVLITVARTEVKIRPGSLRRWEVHKGGDYDFSITIT